MMKTSDIADASKAADLDTPPAVLAPKKELSGPPLVSLNSPIFQEVSIELSARLGNATMPVSDMIALKAGSIVKLGAQLSDLVELKLGQSVVARGEIVAVGDNFGIRIVEVAPLT